MKIGEQYGSKYIGYAFFLGPNSRSLQHKPQKAQLRGNYKFCKKYGHKKYIASTTRNRLRRKRIALRSLRMPNKGKMII